MNDMPNDMTEQDKGGVEVDDKGQGERVDAWQAVFSKCFSLGMSLHARTGREAVLMFIDELHAKANALSAAQGECEALVCRHCGSGERLQYNDGNESSCAGCSEMDCAVTEREYFQQRIAELEREVENACQVQHDAEAWQEYAKLKMQCGHQCNQLYIPDGGTHVVCYECEQANGG